MRIDKEKREKSRFHIYQTMREDPYSPGTAISERTGLSRNTVVRYLPFMRKKQILVGPWLQLKPSSTHPRYMYFVSFSSPDWVFRKFIGFPSILYHARCLGDWNLFFVTDKLLDFSKLIGYSETIYHGKRGPTWDLPAQLTTWDESLSEFDSRLESPHQVDIPQDKLIKIPWTPDEWKLYWAFRNNIRQKVTSTLKRLRIRNETYNEWKRSLDQYTQPFVGYYPQGLPFLKTVYFLLETDQPEYVSSVFEHWPATTILTQIENRLLVQLTFPGGEFPSKIIDLFDDLVTKGVVTSYEFASVFQHLRHTYTEI